MHKNKLATQEQHDFQKDKIRNLNKFFMKSVIYGTVLTFIIFILAVAILLITINTQNIDQTLKISIVSMIATFVLTTTKTLIDKLITVVTFVVRLLSEEQRGFSKNIGIEIDEVDFIEDKPDGDND
jgi:magnesium-transporting ATPase (P-type)